MPLDVTAKRDTPLHPQPLLLAALALATQPDANLPKWQALFCSAQKLSICLFGKQSGIDIGIKTLSVEKAVCRQDQATLDAAYTRGRADPAFQF